MRYLRLSLVLVALVGLSGCLHSEKPLITAEIADYPIADVTKFSKTSLEGKAEAEPNVVVRREGDLYVFDAEGESEPMKGRMKRIAPDTYLAMAMQDDKGWLYALYTHKDGAYFQYTATCDVLKEFADAAKKPLADFATQRVEGNADCDFATLEDVSKAFLFMVDAGLTPDIRYAPLTP